MAKEKTGSMKKTAAVKKSAAAKTKASEKPMKEEFTFQTRNLKDDPKAQAREARRSLIDELTGAVVHDDPQKYVYTVEETGFQPKEFVVCLDIHGCIHQEPVPTYCDYKTFICLLAGLPDKALSNNRVIDFDAEYSFTSFDVKGMNDCMIVTCAMNGTRSLNPYAACFDIKNSTVSVGGNLVFTGLNKGLSKKDAKAVVSAVIKVLEASES